MVILKKDISAGMKFNKQITLRNMIFEHFMSHEITSYEI